MKVRVCRCAMWKTDQGLFNGTVAHLCQVTFLSEMLWTEKCRGDKEFLATLSAQCMNARKNMRAVRCLSTPPGHVLKYSFIITLSVRLAFQGIEVFLFFPSC